MAFRPLLPNLSSVVCTIVSVFRRNWAAWVSFCSMSVDPLRRDPNMSEFVQACIDLLLRLRAPSGYAFEDTRSSRWE